MTPFTPPLLHPAPFDAAAKLGQLPVPDSLKQAPIANIKLSLSVGEHLLGHLYCAVLDPRFENALEPSVRDSKAPPQTAPVNPLL